MTIPHYQHHLDYEKYMLQSMYEIYETQNQHALGNAIGEVFCIHAFVLLTELERRDILIPHDIKVLKKLIWDQIITIGEGRTPDVTTDKVTHPENRKKLFDYLNLMYGITDEELE